MIEIEHPLGPLLQAQSTQVEEAGVLFLLCRDAGAGDGEAFGVGGHGAAGQGLGIRGGMGDPCHRRRG